MLAFESRIRKNKKWRCCKPNKAERIIEKVSEFHFNKDGIEERMAISAGMSEYPKHSIEMKELIAHADLAMYEVKKNGGNAVIAHGDY